VTAARRRIARTSAGWPAAAAVSSLSVTVYRPVGLYWFGVNVTVLGESYRNRSMGKGGSCDRLVELGTAKATYLAGGLEPGIARRPDHGPTAGEAVGWGDVADRAV